MKNINVLSKENIDTIVEAAKTATNSDTVVTATTIKEYVDKIAQDKAADLATAARKLVELDPENFRKLAEEAIADHKVRSAAKAMYEKHAEYLTNSGRRVAFSAIYNYIKAAITGVGTTTNAFDAVSSVAIYSKMLENKGYKDLLAAIEANELMAQWIQTYFGIVFRKRVDPSEKEVCAYMSKQLGTKVYTAGTDPYTRVNNPLGQGTPYMSLAETHIVDGFVVQIVGDSVDRTHEMFARMQDAPLTDWAEIQLVCLDMEAIKRFFQEKGIDATKQFPEGGLPIPGLKLMQADPKMSKKQFDYAIDWRGCCGKLETLNPATAWKPVYRTFVAKSGNTILARDKETNEMMVSAIFPDVNHTARLEAAKILNGFVEKLTNPENYKNLDWPEWLKVELRALYKSTDKIDTGLREAYTILMNQYISFMGQQNRNLAAALRAFDGNKTAQGYLDYEDQLKVEKRRFINAMSNMAQRVYQRYATVKDTSKRIFVDPERVIKIILALSLAREGEKKAKICRQIEALKADRAHDNSTKIKELEIDLRLTVASDFARIVLPNEWAIFVYNFIFQAYGKESNEAWKNDGVAIDDVENGGVWGTAKFCVSTPLRKENLRLRSGQMVYFSEGRAVIGTTLVAEMTRTDMPDGYYVVDYHDEYDADGNIVGQTKPVAVIAATALARASITEADINDGFIAQVDSESALHEIVGKEVKFAIVLGKGNMFFEYDAENKKNVRKLGTFKTTQNAAHSALFNNRVTKVVYGIQCDGYKDANGDVKKGATLLICSKNDVSASFNTGVALNSDC